MANTLVDTDQSTSYVITGIGGRWTFSNHMSLITSDTIGIDVTMAAEDDEVVVNGVIVADAAGIRSIGKNITIRIGDEGVLHGSTYGLVMFNVGQTMVNQGRIFGDSTGASFDNPNAQVTNRGFIHGGVNGLVCASAGGDVVNTSSGEIGGQNAFVFSQLTGQSTNFTNSGLVSGSTFAVVGGAGNEKIVNHGTIEGAIQLAAGNDSFDNRGGKVDHFILGGADNDTLITDKGGTRLFENAGEGTDTVKSTVSYELKANVEHLFLLGTKNINGRGNELANVLSGNSGKNNLNGLLGEDKMTGGGGGDTFVFKTGYGQDIVTDFHSGKDTIDLRGLNGVNGFTDLRTHHLDVSGNSVIIHAGMDTLTLQHVSKSDLHAGDFLF
jgi:Ca2+-binding RTX toxin-like protein